MGFGFSLGGFLLGLLWLYPGLCLGYFLFHRFFILHPSRKITRTPADLGLGYSEVFFPAADSVRLQGWFIPGQETARHPGSPRPVFLFFPGNEGTLSKFLPQVQPLQAAGWDVLMYSYRGFGQSAWRWPLEAGLRQDALGAWTYLTKTLGRDPGRIVFFAQSLGCGVAAWAASVCRPGALILEGGFPSLAEVAARAVPWLPVRWLTTERYDTRRHLHRVACPVLIAHSQDDHAIPFSDHAALLEAAQDPKSFLALRGPHAQGLVVMPAEFIQGIKSFLEPTRVAQP